MTTDRHHLLVGAIRWSALSLAWAGAAGACALVAGLAAGSIALVGFGANALVDGSASAMLVWRFRHERSGTRDMDAVERRAARAVGAALTLIALYLSVAAIAALAQHSSPESSPAGIALTAASVVVLPVLARAKLRLARPLGSAALRGDGILSLAGGGLAASTLIGLLLEAGPGWWWSDAVAALVIAAALFDEGWTTLSGRLGIRLRLSGDRRRGE